MVKCPHEDCRNSDREFHSDGTMRQHHTKIHGERLPNCKCSECGEKFFKKDNGTKYCTECSKKRNHKGSNNPNYKGKADYVDDIKQKATCSVEGCEESRPVALCFHHDSADEKVGNVSRMAIVAEYGIEDLRREVEKCNLICHNCHREKHTGADNSTDAEQEKEEEREIQDIENHTINWDSYGKTDIKVDGYSVFRDEDSRKCILRNCEYCSQRFFTQVHDYKRGRGKFHSLRCAGKSRKGESQKKKPHKDSKLGLVTTVKEEGECSNESCSESRACCLDFHHIEKENKDEEIQQIVAHGDIDKLRSELKKCKLLCANCHQLEHSKSE